ncbi:MAG: hypothetical protein P0S94_05540 [Simkaniaceae bacterium]|nr:hypothetical protein [Simkaniaceae bacterium]
MVAQVGGALGLVWGVVSYSAVTLVASAFFAWMALECVWVGWSRGEATLGERVWNGVFLDIYNRVDAAIERARVEVFGAPVEPVIKGKPVAVVERPIVEEDARENLPEKTREFLELCNEWAAFSLAGNCLPFDVCDLEGNRFQVHMTDQWLAINGYPLRGYEELREKGRFVVFWLLIYHEMPDGDKDVINEVKAFAEKVSTDADGDVIDSPLLSDVQEEVWEGDRYVRSGAQNLELRCVDPVRNVNCFIPMNVEVLAACCYIAREKLSAMRKTLQRTFTYDLVFGCNEDYEAKKRSVNTMNARLNLGHDYGDAELVNHALNMKIKAAWDGGGSLADRVLRMSDKIDERAFFATKIDISFLVSRESRILRDEDTVSYMSLFSRIRDFCPNVVEFKSSQDGKVMEEVGKVFTSGWSKRSIEALRGVSARVVLAKQGSDAALCLGEGDIKTHTRVMRAAMAFRHFLYTGCIPEVFDYQYRTLREDLLSLEMDNELKAELRKAF